MSQTARQEGKPEGKCRTSAVVYEITCKRKDCPATYIGETAKNCHARSKNHIDKAKSKKNSTKEESFMVKHAKEVHNTTDLTNMFTMTQKGSFQHNPLGRRCSEAIGIKGNLGGMNSKTEYRQPCEIVASFVTTRNDNKTKTIQIDESGSVRINRTTTAIQEARTRMNAKEAQHNQTRTTTNINPPRPDNQKEPDDNRIKDATTKPKPKSTIPEPDTSTTEKTNIPKPNTQKSQRTKPVGTTYQCGYKSRNNPKQPKPKEITTKRSENQNQLSIMQWLKSSQENTLTKCKHVDNEELPSQITVNQENKNTKKKINEYFKKTNE